MITEKNLLNSGYAIEFRIQQNSSTSGTLLYKLRAKHGHGQSEEH